MVVTRWDKKRSVELHVRSMADIERVEVMVMRRRLHWLGHLELSDDTCLPKCLLVCCPLVGKHTVGGQKMRWCDVNMRNWKKCNLIPDWCDGACKRVLFAESSWNMAVGDVAAWASPPFMEILLCT